MRLIALVTGVALAITSSVAFAQSAPAAKPAAAPAAAAGAQLSTKSDVTVLLGNPAAKAVLVKHVPEIANNPQIEQAAGMSLKDIQQYAPDQLTDKKLAEIDTDLAKIPAAK